MLGDELGQPLRPDAGLGVEVALLREGRHDLAHRPEPSIRMAERSSTCTAGTGSPAATVASTSSRRAATADSACGALQPRPTSAWRTWSGQTGRFVGAVLSAISGIAPILSRSSR